MTGHRATPGLALAGALALLALVHVGHTPAAHACGCFAPPNPSVPIVQSGERIIFAMQDGVVTAHIQIQYSGDPEEFAWLVPMPAVPELALGTDELFRAVGQATQPSYQLIWNFPGDCNSSSPGCGDSLADASPAEPPPRGGDGPLVLRDAIGPYDYAVLEAGQKQPMLDWLAENGFFVPAGTDDAVTPYIRPGGYFLALRLRKGQSAGDLQPIVVEYQSQLPQIPIVLTSVAADPDMPLLVWIFGEHRAIPRNFFHAHVNDARINWLDGGSNYFAVVGAALDEADGHHAFITEFAGPTADFGPLLGTPERFTNLDVLPTLADPAAYLDAMRESGFPAPGLGDYTSQVLSTLDRHLPIPPALIEAEAMIGQPVDPQSFYQAFRYYADRYPELLDDAYAAFDPAALTAELEERVVVPTLAAAALFLDHPYVTRLFSMLSPEEMTRDPVFSFNPDLPGVSNVHLATLDLRTCSPAGPAVLTTEQGWRLYLPEGTASADWLEAQQPASLRVETLREEGAPELVSDNAEAIDEAMRDFAPPPPGGDGCKIDGAGAGTSRGMGALVLAFGVFVLVGRRRRQRT
jgi:hypothetical protein